MDSWQRMLVEEANQISLFFGEEFTMFRVYFFDQQMEIVEQIDCLVSRKPHRWATAQVKRHGWYTYAIGAIY